MYLKFKKLDYLWYFEKFDVIQWSSSKRPDLESYTVRLARRVQKIPGPKS